MITLTYTEAKVYRMMLQNIGSREIKARLGLTSNGMAKYASHLRAKGIACKVSPFYCNADLVSHKVQPKRKIRTDKGA
jgi:hypothetical protein